MSDNRCGEFFSGIPLATVFLLTLNLSIHACVFLFTIDIRDFTLHPYRIVYYYEFYRCISAALLHGGAMHILMNMMTLYSLGSSMERKFGSFQFFIFSMWTIVLCGVFYCLQSWVLSYVTGDMSYMMQPAVGYSGVLFTYIFIECYHSTTTSRSLFGFFSVPVKMYPWIILVVIQLIMPNISFKGHLSGILVGLLAVHGVMDYIMPSHTFNQNFEVSPCGSGIYRFSNFVPAVDCGFKISTGGTDGDQGLLVTAFLWVKWVVLTIWHFVSTLLYIVGFPVDACTSTLSRWHAASTNYFNTNANRYVFETDTSSSMQQVQPELDRMEAGRNSVISGGTAARGQNDSRYSNGTGADSIGDVAVSPRNQEEIEANRKSAREARLQKFGYNTNNKK